MTHWAITACASGRSRPLTSSEDNIMVQTKWQDGRTRAMTIKRSASDTHGETGIGLLVRFLGFAVFMESLWFAGVPVSSSRLAEGAAGGNGNRAARAPQAREIGRAHV